MNEHTHVPKLLKELRQQFPAAKIIKHADKISSGIPDISVTMRKKTSWWEVKWANPRVDTPGIQHLNCMQLAAYGECWYVIYGIDVGEYTSIVEPKMIDRTTGYFQAHLSIKGHNHQFVADFIRSVHK